MVGEGRGDRPVAREARVHAVREALSQTGKVRRQGCRARLHRVVILVAGRLRALVHDGEVRVDGRLEVDQVQLPVDQLPATMAREALDQREIDARFGVQGLAIESGEVGEDPLVERELVGGAAG